MSVAVQDHYANQKTDVDELIKTHSDLVRKIAWQVHGRTRHTTEIEDIMQIGFTGLVNAAQQYTRKEGATFATYASIRVKGAIIDYLRKSSNLCRTTIQIKKKYNKIVINGSLDVEPSQIIKKASENAIIVCVIDNLEIKHKIVKYGDVFNLGTGTNYSVNEVAKMISENTTIIEPRVGESRETLANINKAKTVLGWKPKVILEQWISEQLNG